MGSTKPRVIETSLVKFSGSQNKMKSHKHGKAVEGKKEQMSGREIREDRAMVRMHFAFMKDKINKQTKKNVSQRLGRLWFSIRVLTLPKPWVPAPHQRESKSTAQYSQELCDDHLLILEHSLYLKFICFPFSPTPCSL